MSFVVRFVRKPKVFLGLIFAGAIALAVLSLVEPNTFTRVAVGVIITVIIGTFVLGAIWPRRQV